MSYPPMRYHGQEGQVSGQFRPNGSPPELRMPTGVDVHYLATAASTSGELGLYRWQMGPEPGGIHAFRNESGSPASMLLLFASGAPREGYFEQLARIVETGRELSAEEWIEFFAEHDQYLV